jgi:hypothetical protein
MKLALALCAALFAVLAGCGSSGGTKTITQVETTPAATTGTTATIPNISIPKPANTTPSKPPASSSGGSLGQAEAVVNGRGYQVEKPGDYEPTHTLRVLIGTKKGSEGHNQRAFFFVGGRFLGTDTSDDSAGIQVAHKQPTVVTLTYQLFRPGDPLCCPTGGQTDVRYSWNGQKLTPLDPIPSSSAKADPSRL